MASLRWPWCRPALGANAGRAAPSGIRPAVKTLAVLTVGTVLFTITQTQRRSTVSSTSRGHPPAPRSTQSADLGAPFAPSPAALRDSRSRPSGEACSPGLGTGACPTHCQGPETGHCPAPRLLLVSPRALFRNKSPVHILGRPRSRHPLKDAVCGQHRPGDSAGRAPPTKRRAPGSAPGREHPVLGVESWLGACHGERFLAPPQK